MTVAVLGPGGVGGFVAGVLARAREPVSLVGTETTVAHLKEHGLRVDSVRLGTFIVRPPAVSRIEGRVDVLVVAVKAPALATALDRVAVPPTLVVPLLNGVEHVAVLRERFGADRVCAASIRIASERIGPGHVVHSSPLVRIELAPDALPVATAFSHRLRGAEIPTIVREREADVLWGKLSRLNALALTTAASGRTIGEVLAHPRWRLLLEGAVDETAAVARAEGADVDPHGVLGELAELVADQTSSLARDVAAGREHELDAIGGAVLRAAARHGIAAPAVDELVQAVRERVP